MIRIPKLPKWYYDVPSCPVCGSRKTGRYIRKPYSEADTRYAVEQSLRHGELVRLSFKVPDNNLYCEDCGYEWHGVIFGKLVPGEKVEEEILARGTVEKYSKYEEENPKKKKTIFGKVFGFLP